MNWSEFCRKIKILLGDNYCNYLCLESDESNIVFYIKGEKYLYSKKEFKELQKEVKQIEHTQFELFDGHIIESLVDDRGLPRRLMQYNEEESFSVLDDDLNLKYYFGDISERMMYIIIAAYDGYKTRLAYLSSFGIERRIEDLREVSLFEIIKCLSRLPKSMYIETSNEKWSFDKMKQFGNSFIFNMAYNYSRIITKLKEIEYILPNRSVMRQVRTHNLDDMVAPHLIYKEELVEQYYMSLASESPFVEFLGYYHVLEHFFEEVYKEEIFLAVQSKIMHPGFSVRRKRDIQSIVDLIVKKTRINKQEYVGSEQEALELTLKKYIDIDELKDSLCQRTNENLIDYYSGHEVSFSKGDCINFEDENKIFTKLASRIYKTRNSLVHSKSNELRENQRGIYNPLKDDLELRRENAIMKILAEIIIIKTAKPLE